MRRLVSAIVLATALALPAGAAAKEITSATICGADGCMTTGDKGVLQGLMQGGPSVVPTKKNAPVLRVRAAVTERPGGKVMGRFTSWWVPSQRLLVAEDGTWMRVDPFAERSLVKIARGMAPLPASRMRTTLSTIVQSPMEPPATMVPPPDIRRVPAATVDTGGGIDWLLIAIPVGAVLAAAGGLLLYARRRRPGGGGAVHPAAP